MKAKDFMAGRRPTLSKITKHSAVGFADYERRLERMQSIMQSIQQAYRGTGERAVVVLEVIGPIPGTLISRSHPASCWARAAISLDNRSIRSSSRRQSAKSLMIRTMRADSTSGDVAKMRGNSARKNR